MSDYGSELWLDGYEYAKQECAEEVARLSTEGRELLAALEAIHNTIIPFSDKEQPFLAIRDITVPTLLRYKW
ncbi:MAG: hypothetical protein WBC22_00780 [Sedimentisphaerales bacterium]